MDEETAIQQAAEAMYVGFSAWCLSTFNIANPRWEYLRFDHKVKWLARAVDELEQSPMVRDRLNV